MVLNGTQWYEIQKIPAPPLAVFSPGPRLAGSPSQGKEISKVALGSLIDRTERPESLTDLERESTSATRRSVGRQVSS